MKLLIVGGNGLVGSKVAEHLKASHDVLIASRLSGLDVTKISEVGRIIGNSNPDIIINFSAKADVDGCEDDRAKDEEMINSSQSFEGVETAYGVNSYGAQNLAQIAKEYGKQLIHISTDFVFDGENEEPYTEEDRVNPINWYAKTKQMGEEKVFGTKDDAIIVRIAYPYRASFEKKDFFRAIKARLDSHASVAAVEDHIMTPTFIDDIGPAIGAIINSKFSGIIHVVGSEFISPLQASLKIAEVFGCDKSLITKTTRAEFFKGRAPRPFHLALKNDKIGSLGIKMKTFEEGLFEIKNNL